MIEPLWWIRQTGVVPRVGRGREPQVSGRDKPTRAAFFCAPFSRNANAFRDLFSV